MAERDGARFPRFSAERVRAALADTPVVMLVGPRQSGKTTLVRELAGGRRTYVALDDDTTLAAALSDPVGFLRGHDRVTIDEVQRAPALLRAVKLAVDNDRRPGRFLLTGSADVLTLPRVSESLAGRLEVVTLMPLAMAELRGRRPRFLEHAFDGEVAQPAAAVIGDELVRAVLTGGYPEMVRRRDPKRRQSWARSYVRTLVERDVRDIVEVERLELMPRLLRGLALGSGQLVNYTQLGGQLGLDDKTTRRYVRLFEQLFLIRSLEPWFSNRLKRLVKTPKLHFLDSGLLAALSGATSERLARHRPLFGPLLESFVFAELLKQAGWSDESYAVHHYRDRDQDEVDFVIEDSAGALVGIEVKAAATVTGADFKGLRKLAAGARADFRAGIVLYDGELALPFGDRLYAAPLACLWE